MSYPTNTSFHQHLCLIQQILVFTSTHVLFKKHQFSPAPMSYSTNINFFLSKISCWSKSPVSILKQERERINYREFSLELHFSNINGCIRNEFDEFPPDMTLGREGVKCQALNPLSLSHDGRTGFLSSLFLNTAHRFQSTTRKGNNSSTSVTLRFSVKQHMILHNNLLIVNTQIYEDVSMEDIYKHASTEYVYKHASMKDIYKQAFKKSLHIHTRD